jgi:hypothetical protein
LSSVLAFASASAFDRASFTQLLVSFLIGLLERLVTVRHVLRFQALLEHRCGVAACSADRWVAYEGG